MPWCRSHVVVDEHKYVRSNTHTYVRFAAADNVEYAMCGAVFL